MATAATKGEGSCDGDCMMATRYANIIHAQRKHAVETRLAELARDDPEHYFDAEWSALHDAAIDLHIDPVSMLRDVPMESGNYTRLDHDAVAPRLLSVPVRDEPIREDGEPRGVRWTERVSTGDNI